MKLCHRQLTEIQDACLECDSILDCFPMDDDCNSQLKKEEKHYEPV